MRGCVCRLAHELGRGSSSAEPTCGKQEKESTGHFSATFSALGQGIIGRQGVPADSHTHDAWRVRLTPELEASFARGVSGRIGGRSPLLPGGREPDESADGCFHEHSLFGRTDQVGDCVVGDSENDGDAPTALREWLGRGRSGGPSRHGLYTGVRLCGLELQYSARPQVLGNTLGGSGIFTVTIAKLRLLVTLKNQEFTIDALHVTHVLYECDTCVLADRQAHRYP